MVRDGGVGLVDFEGEVEVRASVLRFEGLAVEGEVAPQITDSVPEGGLFLGEISLVKVFQASVHLVGATVLR